MNLNVLNKKIISNSFSQRPYMSNRMFNENDADKYLEDNLMTEYDISYLIEDRSISHCGILWILKNKEKLEQKNLISSVLNGTYRSICMYDIELFKQHITYVDTNEVYGIIHRRNEDIINDLIKRFPDSFNNVFHHTNKYHHNILELHKSETVYDLSHITNKIQWTGVDYNHLAYDNKTGKHDALLNEIIDKIEYDKDHIWQYIRNDMLFHKFIDKLKNDTIPFGQISDIAILNKLKDNNFNITNHIYQDFLNYDNVECLEWCMKNIPLENLQLEYHIEMNDIIRDSWYEKLEGKMDMMIFIYNNKEALNNPIIEQN